MRPRLFLVLAGAALLAWPSWAGDRVVAVSPGSPAGALIGDTCPTFSWGAMNESESYELVVWRLDAAPIAESAVAEGVEPEATSAPALRATIPGAALSWTPSLDRCLEDGHRYAWVVRGLTPAGGAGEWSEARVFEVVPRPGVEGVGRDRVGGDERSRRASGPADAITSWTPVRGEALEPPEFRAEHHLATAGWLSLVASSFKADSLPKTESPWTYGGAAIAGELLPEHTWRGWAVVGRAGEGTGVYGTAGTSYFHTSSVPIGVWGQSGQEGYGVKGETWSKEGFSAGGFISYEPGGIGVSSFGATEDDLALVVGTYWAGDDGRIGSMPWMPSSDIILVSNDAVAVRLDQNKDGEDADFEIIDKDGVLIFNVDESGDGWIKGALVQGSARAAKQDLEPVDTRAMLEGVAALPLYRWTYRADSGTSPHLGPMAEDFHAMFALGGDPNGIATVDADGVALAAIQALVEEVEALKARVAALEAQQSQAGVATTVRPGRGRL